MSREQWGHGFHAGLIAQKKNKSHRFVTTHKNGRMSFAGIVIEEREDETLTIEWIDYLSMEVFARTGGAPDTKHVEPGNIEDMALSELVKEAPRFHATWSTVISEFAKDWIVKDLHEVQEEVGISCCFNCGRDSGKCGEWHNCGENCPGWKKRIKNDLISRSALIERYGEPCHSFLDVIETMPAVDAEPVRHGKWLKASGMLPPGYRDEIRCSVCANFALRDRLGRVRASCYCPNCGARMDADREYAHQKELNEKNEHNCRRLTEAERVIFNDALESVYGMTGCSMDGQGEGDAE